MSTVTRRPNPGDKYLVTGRLGAVETVTRLLQDDHDAAREVLLALGLITPVAAAPAPTRRPRTAPSVRRLIPISWLMMPHGRRLHAVREGRTRTVCGSRLGSKRTWRVPTETELADPNRCPQCMSFAYVARSVAP